jgi:hypothetical protein
MLSACGSAKDMWKEEDPIKQMVVDHSCRQQKQHEIELVAMNTPLSGKRRPFYIHYLSHNKMNVPQVREIVVDTIESFLQDANQCEEMQEVLRNRPLEVEDIIFNIGMLQHDGQFFEPPCIAYAYVKEGIVHYCYYDNLFGKFTNYDDVKEPYYTAKNLALRQR